MHVTRTHGEKEEGGNKFVTKNSRRDQKRSNRNRINSEQILGASRKNKLPNIGFEPQVLLKN
uniref:Uncharacterized protein n=1 Tax=Arion vulgaris TaxID=1028688 RepID=A0A0B7ATD3_9EUPU